MSGFCCWCCCFVFICFNCFCCCWLNLVLEGVLDAGTFLFVEILLVDGLVRLLNLVVLVVGVVTCRKLAYSSAWWHE